MTEKEGRVVLVCTLLVLLAAAVIVILQLTGWGS